MRRRRSFDRWRRRPAAARRRPAPTSGGPAERRPAVAGAPPPGPATGARRRVSPFWGGGSADGYRRHAVAGTGAAHRLERLSRWGFRPVGTNSNAATSGVRWRAMAASTAALSPGSRCASCSAWSNCATSFPARGRCHLPRRRLRGCAGWPSRRGHAPGAGSSCSVSCTLRGTAPKGVPRSRPATPPGRWRRWIHPVDGAGRPPPSPARPGGVRPGASRRSRLPWGGETQGVAALTDLVESLRDAAGQPLVGT